MISMGEHMLNALIQGLNDLKQEYSEKTDKLTYTVILKNVYRIVAQYTVDRKDIMGVFGTRDLSLNEFQALKDMGYEDNN